MEPERLILRSLAGKSRGWLVRRFGLCLPKFRKRRDFRLSGTLPASYITYPRKKKYQFGEDSPVFRD